MTWGGLLIDIDGVLDVGTEASRIGPGPFSGRSQPSPRSAPNQSPEAVGSLTARQTSAWRYLQRSPGLIDPTRDCSIVTIPPLCHLATRLLQSRRYGHELAASASLTGPHEGEVTRVFSQRRWPLVGGVLPA